jgi:putative oxidoreductase
VNSLCIFALFSQAVALKYFCDPLIILESIVLISIYPGGSFMSSISHTGFAEASERGTSETTSAVRPLIIAAGRLFYVAIFLMSGVSHFTAKPVAYAAAAGVPFPSLAVPASGVLALAGALSILLGYRARIGAWLLVLFLVPVTLMMHNFWAVKDPMMAQMQMAMFMKNVSMLGGALLISQFGAGPWSLDARRN